MALLLLFSFLTGFVTIPDLCAYARDPSSSPPDVLVSGPVNAQATLQDVGDNNEGSDASLEKTVTESSKGPTTSGRPEDEIIAKSTDMVMSQITANMKLTQDQLNAVRPIIEDYEVRLRNLQISLQKGDIEGKAMYNQRQQFTTDEDVALNRIFTSDQMKVWINIQEQ